MKVIKEMCPLIQSANRIWYFDENSHLYLPKTEVLYGQFHYEDDPEDSTLRAFKILKVLYGKDKTHLFVKIAGLGCGYVGNGDYFYASPEEFVRGKRTNALTGTYFRTIDRIKESGCGTIRHWSTGAYDVYRYAWSNNKPESGSVYVVISYDVASKHLNVTTDRRDKYPYPTEEECILDNQVNVIELDDEPEPVKQALMDESHEHDRELVRRINDAWDKRRSDFRPILCALYDRDLDEIYSHSVKEIGHLPDSRFHTLSEEWEKWAGPYLRVVATNKDLSTILDFLEF